MTFTTATRSPQSVAALLRTRFGLDVSTDPERIAMVVAEINRERERDDRPLAERNIARPDKDALKQGVHREIRAHRLYPEAVSLYAHLTGDHVE